MSSNVLLKWTFGPSHAVLSISDIAVMPILSRSTIHHYGEEAPDELLTKLSFLIGIPWIDPQDALAQLATADYRCLKYGELRFYRRSWFEKDRVAVVDRGTKGGLI